MTRYAPTRVVRGLEGDKLSIDIQNVGLAYHKLAPLNAGNAAAQANFIRGIGAHAQVAHGYLAAFERWVRRTPVDAWAPGWQREVRLVSSQGRVLCGLGNASPTENGLSLHPVHGTPILPGSSLKGIARAWCASRFEAGDWAEGGQYFQQVFGEDAGTDRDEGGLAAAVHFLDALWQPTAGTQPWAAEILTPHMGRYYAGKSAPDGTQNPVPVTFLAAQGTFRIVVEGPPVWAQRGMDILLRALTERGVGAKTRAGYGRFLALDRLTSTDEAAAEARKRQVERIHLQAAVSAADPAGRVAILCDEAPEGPQGLIDWVLGRDVPELFEQHLPRDLEHGLAATGFLYQRNLISGLKKKVDGRPEESWFPVIGEPAPPPPKPVGELSKNQQTLAAWRALPGPDARKAFRQALDDGTAAAWPEADRKSFRVEAAKVDGARKDKAYKRWLKALTGDARFK